MSDVEPLHGSATPASTARLIDDGELEEMLEAKGPEHNHMTRDIRPETCPKCAQQSPLEDK